MKKFAFLFVFALAGSLFLASCSGTDDDNTVAPKPNINWKGGNNFTSVDTEVAAGNSINFGINASATSGDITRVRVTVNVNGSGALILADSTLEEENVSIDWNNVTVGSLPGAKIVYTATATQSNGQSSSVSFIITVTSAPLSIQTRPNITLGAQDNTTLGSFFDYTNQTTLFLGQANSSPGDVDFIYYSGATNGIALSSPDDSKINQIFPSVDNWSIRNNTRLRKTTISAADFDALTDGSSAAIIENEAKAGGGSSIAPQLKVDDVLVFVTAGAQEFGLIKITSITPGANGTITFDLKFGV